MKIKGLLFVAFYCVCGVLKMYGQGWERMYDEFFSSWGLDIITLEEGGYITLSDFGNNDVQIMKIDEEGEIIWESHSANNTEAYTGTPVDLAAFDNESFYVLTRRHTGTAMVMGLIRFDSDGVLEWYEEFQAEEHSFNVTAMVPDEEGILMLGQTYIATDDLIKLYLIKVDHQGEVIWEQIHNWESDVVQYKLSDIRPASAGGFIGVGVGDENDQILGSVVRFDETGNILWEQDYAHGETLSLRNIEEAPNGDFILSGTFNIWTDNNPFIIRIDENGNELWTHSYDYPELDIAGMTKGIDSGYVICGSRYRNDNDTPVGFMLKIDEEGEEEWIRIVEHYGSDSYPNLVNITQTLDQGYIAIGYIDTTHTFIKKTDYLGNSYSARINGTVYVDANENCNFDGGEMDLSNWIVQIDGDDLTHYRSTNEDGFFEFAVDTGTYSLLFHPPNNYWVPCTDSIEIPLPSPYDTTQIDLGVQHVLDCPFLSVDISTPFLRRCFENTYTVFYQNYGTTIAEGAKIELVLDQYLSIVSSEIPYIELGNNTFSFDIGDVPINESGNFQLVTYVDCDSTVLGQTHCVEAHIYPDSICTDSILQQPVIALEGRCEGDSVIFILKNVGEGDMNTTSDYIVIEDDVMYAPMPYQIDSEDSTKIVLNASGSTYRLEALRFPENSEIIYISQTVEGCSNGDFSIGFVNQFSLLPNSDFEDIDCQENIGSYDPNDKRGFPYGYGEAHFIKPGTSLDYHIRFQNTGTDTAFTVVIKDTLASLLNPATVRIGAASHDYSWDLTGEGILTFTFNNIILPDSNVNEAASHGFVSFNIEPRTPQQLGDVIKNNAAIYFDFNEPIITNTTFHTVNEGFVEIINTSNTVEHAVQIEIKAYPNPTTNEQVTLEIDALKVAEGTFYLYTTQGQLIHTQRFDNPTFTIDLVDFSSGLYFFSLELKQGKRGTGKLIINK